MNRLSEINRASLQAYLSTKLNAGALNMSQYEAAEAATGFLGTTITRDNVLGAMQKLKRKWPTKRARICRSIKNYSCNHLGCNFKSTSPVAVKIHYGDFPLHAPPKKGRKMANAMTTDKLEETRIKKSVGKIATKPLDKLKINQLRKLAGAMHLLDGGVGIGATKAEYTALIEAKRKNNKRGITVITKKIAARNAAKKFEAANRTTTIATSQTIASKKAPLKYNCSNPDCNFKATSGFAVARHYKNGVCPKLAYDNLKADIAESKPKQQSPVTEDIVQHRCAEVTVTKVDLNFCCNCRCDLTKHREGLDEGYSTKFCPDCGMPLPSFPS